MPPRIVPFTIASDGDVGDADTKLTTPLSALGPYSDDMMPLVTSTRSRSTAGIWSGSSPSGVAPYSGKPSERIFV